MLDLDHQNALNPNETQTAEFISGLAAIYGSMTKYLL